MNSINLAEVSKFIASQSASSRIYLGCDSERFRIGNLWYADYTLAIVVHLDGKHGCKIFGEVQRERDFDQRASRPAVRLMTEVFKVSELYLKLQDVLHNRLVEVHLDLNPNEQHGSSCVIQQAVGYVRGVCNLDPKVKPHGWAASYCADRLKDLGLVAHPILQD